MSTPIGSVIHDAVDGDMKIMTDNGLVTIGTGLTSSVTATTGYASVTNSTITLGSSFDMDEFLDRFSFNKITVDHKVTAHEFLKLKESVPTYADEIKEFLAKDLSRDIIKKATFTKKVDINADVQHFIARTWVFTEAELKELIKEARNVC
jgi:hypothetical protein